MRTEISQAKREANFYVQNVEKGKAIEAMETRKRKKADQVCYLIISFLEDVTSSSFAWKYNSTKLERVCVEEQQKAKDSMLLWGTIQYNPWHAYYVFLKCHLGECQSILHEFALD